MSFYAQVQNGEITRINISLPFTTATVSIPKGATGLEAFGLYPITGDEPSYDPATQRLAGPTYNFSGSAVERVYTVEAIPDTEKAAQVRAQRDRLLAECDWVTIKAVDASADGLGIQLPQVWIDYRKALRDIPTQAGFPWTVTWPDKP